jgi:hypothetical protein
VRKFLLSLPILLFPLLASAQAINYLPDYSQTVGTSAVAVTPNSSNKQTILLCNSGATNIGIGLTSSVSIGAAGTIELVPNGTSGVGQNCLPFGPGTAPLQQLWAISSGSSGYLTVWVGHNP